jgi:tight adherence protein B
MGAAVSTGARTPVWFESRLASALARADVPWPAAAVARWWAVAAAGLGLAGLVAGGAATGVALAAVVLVAPAAAAGAVGDRAARRAERELPGIIDEVAGALRTGAALPAGLASAAAGAREPLAGDLVRVVAAIERGVPAVEALDGWAANRALPGLRLAAGAVAVSTAAGGSPARALEGVAATLRGWLHASAEARALGTQARLSAMVISVAPVGFTMCTIGLDTGAAEFLLTTGPGRLCLAAGLALDLAGAAWMARITKVEP